MLNLMEVNGSIGQNKFWRYWLLCSVANGVAVGLLAAGGLIAYRIVIG